MNYETILTTLDIFKIAQEHKDDPCALARAIEQAVLQSPEVQAWKRDAERYRYIQSKIYASNAYGRPSWKFHYDGLPLPLDNPTKGSVAQHFDDAIDAAMEQQA